MRNILRRRPKRDSQKTPGSSAQISSDLYEFLETAKAAQRKSGGSLAILKRQTSGAKPVYQRAMSLQEAVEADSFLTYLLATCGNGDYVIQVLEPSGKLVREFAFAVGKITDPRSAADDSRPSGSAQTLEMIKTMAEILKPAGNGNFIETIKALGELQKDGKEFQAEVMALLLQNALGDHGDPVEQAIRMIELAKTLQPQIQQEDSMTGLLQTAMLYLMGQGGMKANPLAALAATQQATPPGQTGQSQGAASLAASPPAPTLPGGAQARDSRVILQGEATSSPGAAPVAAQAQAPPDPHQAFFDMTILPFCRAVEAGATPEQLGNMILGIVGTAKQWQPDNPHPIVAQLVAAGTAQELSLGFDTFCNALPQLKSKPDLQRQIKDYLTGILTQAYRQQEQAAREVQEAVRSSFGQVDDEDDEDVYGSEVGEPGEPGAAEDDDEDRPDGGPDGSQQQDADDTDQVGQY